MSKKKTKPNRTSKQRRKVIPRENQGRRHYTDDERRAAVGDVAEVGLSGAARKHGIPVSTLHAWTKLPQWTEATKETEGEPDGSRVKKQRFTDEERQHALGLVVSGMTREAAARAIGTTSESIRRWIRAAEKAGTMPTMESLTGRSCTDQAPQTPAAGAKVIRLAPEGKPASVSVYAPRDPGQGLSDIETAAILELKKRYPSLGPAQIRAQLKRFKGWRISIKAIARVLRHHGYEPVHRGSRPQGPEPVRFEAPRRNALWQLDYAEMRVAGEVLHMLVVLDDFSRYCVGHVLGDRPSAKIAIEVLRRSIARHGKPDAVRSDRGGAFNSKEFGEWLEDELIDHVVGRSYHPQGGGKVESLIGTVRRELWDVEEFANREEATRRLNEFLSDYNERRAHMGIDGLTPADRFFGRADRVLDAINALSRQRQSALARGSITPAVEELVWPKSGAPLEVLRLVAMDGQLELRFAGHRVVLGPLESA